MITTFFLLGMRLGAVENFSEIFFGPSRSRKGVPLQGVIPFKILPQNCFPRGRIPSTFSRYAHNEIFAHLWVKYAAVKTMMLLSIKMHKLKTNILKDSKFTLDKVFCHRRELKFLLFFIPISQ